MFILSQKREDLVNAKNLKLFYLSDDKKSIHVLIAETRALSIATYETPERTKEVFNELCSTHVYRNVKLYEMPEK